MSVSVSASSKLVPSALTRLAMVTSVGIAWRRDDTNHVANVRWFQLLNQRVGIMLGRRLAPVCRKRDSDKLIAARSKMRVQSEGGILSQPHAVEILDDQCSSPRPDL